MKMGTWTLSIFVFIFLKVDYITVIHLLFPPG